MDVFVFWLQVNLLIRYLTSSLRYIYKCNLYALQKVNKILNLTDS